MVQQPRRRSGWAPQALEKGAVKMILRVTRLLVRSSLYIEEYDNYIQHGSHDCRGVDQSSGFKGKNCQSCQSRPEQTE
jgi:hypothetical protein